MDLINGSGTHTCKAHTLYSIPVHACAHEFFSSHWWCDAVSASARLPSLHVVGVSERQTGARRE